MTGFRLKMSEEGLLWKTALEHFGLTGLHQVVVELWMDLSELRIGGLLVGFHGLRVVGRPNFYRLA